MNKNAFINAACALLGAGGRGFVKALAFVALGAFCAPVFAADKAEREFIKAIKNDPAVLCKKHTGFYHNGKCYINVVGVGHDYTDGVKVCNEFYNTDIGEGRRICAVDEEKILYLGEICANSASGCPSELKKMTEANYPKNACSMESAEEFPLPLADLSKAGVLDYIKRNFNPAEEQGAIINTCRVILGAIEDFGRSSKVAMNGCKSAKDRCLKDSYCPYKDSDYEAELRELEKFHEPLVALFEEAKKCIKDTENFLNPAAASE